MNFGGWSEHAGTICRICLTFRIAGTSQPWLARVTAASLQIPPTCLLQVFGTTVFCLDREAKPRQIQAS